MKEYLTRKRKGFTLVELLIVIVVIGILSAMMMLSSSEAVSSAKATTIVSDMRNLKTAVLAYFADHEDYLTKDPSNFSNKVDIDEVMPYLNGKDFPSKSSFEIISDGGHSVWYIRCNITEGNNAIVKGAEQVAVKKKLAGRAKSVGLLASTYKTNETPQAYGAEGTDGKYACMLVQ